MKKTLIVYSSTMAIKSSQFFAIVGILFISLATTIESSNPSNVTAFNRSSFPAGFVFGTASAAYQYEGAPKEGGKGPSIWDNFTHKYSERIDDASNGDVAQDFYHRYKGDVQIMKDMGTDAFRFSISWPRILPRGTLKGGVSKEGIKFYNNLINELLANGQTPFVTLFHWDLPQALDDKYGGFLSAQSVADFQDFAEVCYKAFGDRVKHWITFNEPYTYTSGGYNYGYLAPGRCSSWLSSACQAGNSSTEPYIASHNILLAHAAAVKLYRAKYQAFQKGKIGITLISHWFVPYSNTPNDTAAAKRAIDFMFGWYMHPVTYGHYPKNMRKIVKERLPKFTKKQSISLKGSCDFIGVNYYTANYAINVPNPDTVNLAYTTDSHANLTASRNGKLIGAQAGSTWLYIYPQGFHDLLVYTKKTYKNPTIYITENGVSEVNNSSLPIKEALKDPVRINYYYRHLLALHKAISEGVNVKGYFAWSLLDNFEWNAGYTVRFGIIYIDYNKGVKRYAKDSFYWFKKFLLK